ncbi:MAG: type II toxin-antitoxin system RelE/ParE family toxin [Blautia sp.]|nr:type II toxin-antitoxin system RelE/ParE family toxin [Blautia sp.]
MNDNYNIIYSPQAKDDIKNIYSYIAFELQVPDTARKQINRIREKIRSLDLMPARYGIVDWEPWQSMSMHKLLVDNFIVYYTAHSDTLIVTIIRIVYERMDTQSIIKTE